MAGKSKILTMNDKILMGSYILIALGYGVLFYVKWKEKTKS